MAKLDAADVDEMYARVCKALADPKRLLIINELRDGPMAVGDIAGALKISQPNVSRHLAVLRDRGFVTAERLGSQRPVLAGQPEAPSRGGPAELRRPAPAQAAAAAPDDTIRQPNAA